MKKRSLADTNIRKLSTAINKLPEFSKLPMTNIYSREVIGIKGNNIQIRLNKDVITVNIRKMDNIDNNVLSAVIGALKSERAQWTEEHVIDRFVEGVKLSKSQIKQLELRGFKEKNLKDIAEKVKTLTRIKHIRNALKGTDGVGRVSNRAYESVLRALFEERKAEMEAIFGMVTDNLFEFVYFHLYGAQDYSRAELMAFTEWLEDQGAISLEEFLFDNFDYTEDMSDAT